MDNNELLPLLLQVLKNPYTIGTTIVIILLMNFCCFVANYRQKPPKPKKSKKSAPAAAPAAEKPVETASPKEGENS